MQIAHSQPALQPALKLVLAEHRTHSWAVRGRDFFRLDCERPVRLHFENDKGETSEVYGPFYWRYLVVKSAAAPAA